MIPYKSLELFMFAGSFPWPPDGFPMASVWSPSGHQKVLNGLPMVSLWFPYGVVMVFMLGLSL